MKTDFVKYSVVAVVSFAMISGLAHAGKAEKEKKDPAPAAEDHVSSTKCQFPASECMRIRKEHKYLQLEVQRLKKELALEQRLATDKEAKDLKLQKKIRKQRATMLRGIRAGMSESDVKTLLGRADDIKTDSVGGVWLVYEYTGEDNRDHKYKVHINKLKKVDIPGRIE